MPTPESWHIAAKRYLQSERERYHKEEPVANGEKANPEESSNGRVSYLWNWDEDTWEGPIGA